MGKQKMIQLIISIGSMLLGSSLLLILYRKIIKNIEKQKEEWKKDSVVFEETLKTLNRMII